VTDGKKNGRILLDRPKPPLGCSASGKRRGRRGRGRRREEEEKRKKKKQKNKKRKKKKYTTNAPKLFQKIPTR
jgi:hypothetical protein